MAPTRQTPIGAARPGAGAAGASAADGHAVRVDRVVSQLRAHRGKRPVSLEKRAVSHLVPKRRDLRRTDDKIDISDLDEILEIDAVAMTATAEPGVTFEDLVSATLPFGLAPVIVPELRTITVGGAVSGCSVESMSFANGGFHDTCLEYEIVTATGEVLRCTPDNEHRLVFQMIHGSFGTLGILTKLRFRLVAAKPWVRVTYQRFATLRRYKEAILRHFVDRDVDFMDGIIHAPDLHVLSLGRFVDRAPYTNRYDWVKVYYQSTARRREDYLDTEHYFFRYDNGVTNPTPKSAINRLLFGKFTHSAQILRLAEKMPWLLPRKPNVTLDVFIPFSRVDEFLGWYHRAIGFYPIWMVPYRRVRDYEWLSPAFWAGVNDPLFLDLAVYGMKQRGARNYYKEIEDELSLVNGVKTLISYNYYEEAAFWAIWNRPNYLAVKSVTDPNGIFRDLYTKTCRAARGVADRARASGQAPIPGSVR